MTMSWHDFVVFINGAATGAVFAMIFLMPAFLKLRKLVHEHEKRLRNG